MDRPAIRKPAIWLGLLLVGVAACACAQEDPPLAPEPLNSKAASKLLVSDVKPDYPPVAQVNYIQGQVEVMLTVGQDGHVRRVHALKGNALLAAAALKAVASWVYRPLLTASGPKAFSTLVKVRFNLRQHDLEHSPSTPERDLAEVVKPPEIVQRVPASVSASPSRAPSSIRLQVLVGENGRAIDSTLVSGPAALFASAERNVSQWAFRPARWGNLTVPWYMDVDVPVEATRNSATWAPPSKR
jgi:TonB family protein